MLRDQGKPAAAAALLAPVYAWFTEGFDTVPLRAAKALLDEFGGHRGHAGGPISGIGSGGGGGCGPAGSRSSDLGATSGGASRIG